jgi:hypothetical protein
MLLSASCFTFNKNSVMMNIRFFLLSISAVCLFTYSCSTGRNEKVEKSFSIVTNNKPGSNGISNFFGAMNDLLEQKASESGADSVVQFEQNTKVDTILPNYRDLACLVITSPEQLKKMLPMSYSDIDMDNKIEAIDFKNNFVLIAAHPIAPVMVNGEINRNGAYYLDDVEDRGVKNKSRKIKLSAMFVGNNTITENYFSQKWSSNVYILKRKDCNTVIVEIDEKSYSFTI